MLYNVHLQPVRKVADAFRFHEWILVGEFHPPLPATIAREIVDQCLPPSHYPPEEDPNPLVRVTRAVLHLQKERDGTDTGLAIGFVYQHAQEVPPGHNPEHYGARVILDNAGVRVARQIQAVWIPPEVLDQPAGQPE